MSTALHKYELLQNLKDDDYREGFLDSHIYTGLSFQLKTLREKKGMTQAALGKAAGMAQERISVLEDPNASSKPTIATLLRLAKVLGVGLRVRFAPFSDLLDEATRTDENELDVIDFLSEVGELERGCEG